MVACAHADELESSVKLTPLGSCIGVSVGEATAEELASESSVD